MSSNDHQFVQSFREKKKKKKSYIPAINLFPEPNQPRLEGNLQQIISLQTRKFTSHQIAQNAKNLL